MEHQIFRFAEMILRDRCSTSYDLASLIRGRPSGKIAKRISTRRKSRRIAAFLMLSPSKMGEVLQNCCVFDVVKLKDSGSLAE